MGKKKPVAKTPKQKVISLRMDATFFFERAVRSLDRYHYEKALKYFRRAVEFEPDNPVNHCNMAGILSELGQYDQSNDILRSIVDQIDPGMTECYFYMANNFANMEDYEAAEEALVYYLEHDLNGQFLDEAEEMMELLSFELERPMKLRTIKSREGIFEHDKARVLLEEGKFTEAARMLEKLIKKHPDLLAARNNLALAYYYIGDFEHSIEEIRAVLSMDPGNLHSLCNLAIFYQHFGHKSDLSDLVNRLRRTYPFQQEHVFKLATTMGILHEHEAAFRHFHRLIRSGEAGLEPCLFHYAAVAAYNTGRTAEAKSLWRKAAKYDPGSEIPRFYLSELANNQQDSQAAPLSYHYHLPFEDEIRLPDKGSDGLHEQLNRNPLVRSSFFWALKHGDFDTKLQVLQAFGKVKDREAEHALFQFILEPDEDEYLKKVAIFVLRIMGVNETIFALMDGKKVKIDPSRLAPNLPKWEEKWQQVMETALRTMDKRYDLIQQHDLQTLWVEFLTRSYPTIPNVSKIEGWAAALEYLTAKMHRREISYQEVSIRYGSSVQTISKHAKTIDRACGLKEKMEAIYPHYNDKI
jgi:tetratricopeptide (TPR) repeat protein